MSLMRAFDIVLSFILLLVTSPILLVFCFFVYVSDFNSPIYVSIRIGINNKPFKIFKLRSMIVNADQVGPETTKSTDERITKIGSLIRKYKLDELTQLYNVLIGDMSLVGPRPNTPLEVAKYNDAELNLLSATPGITDFASIIFSDEGEILKNSVDPVSDYDKYIRPWKQKFGQLYLDNKSLTIYLYLCIITFISIFANQSPVI